MATIRKIIERADRRKPNSFSTETKLLWIAQLDGKIAQDVMLMGVEELQQFDYQYPEDLDRKPLVSFPHEDLYDLWLEAQIDARNGEWNRYQNTIELYNAAYSNFVGWFVNTYKPGQGCSCNGWVPQPGVPQYYITAYGLAVKAGYGGSLQEWLASLKGEKGDKGDPGAKLKIGTVTTLPAGSKATAAIGGTVQEPVLDLGIPEAFYTYKAKAGFIYPLASETAPEGFLLCDGAEYSRTEYIELFAAIGTTYGEGDGKTTFNVPDLATRVPVGTGEGFKLGAAGGEAEHVLTVDEMPSHSHKWSASTNRAVGDDASYLAVGDGASWGDQYDNTTTTTGGDQPHNNMPPYTVVQYIIATGKDTAVSVQDIILGAQTIPLGIKYGGTDATNAAQARKNLEVFSKEEMLPDALAQSLCPDAEDPTPADALAALLPKSGGTMKGPVDMGNNKISGISVMSAYQASAEYLNLTKLKTFKSSNATAYLSLPRGGKMAFLAVAHTQSGACAYVASCEQDATSGTVYKLCGDDYANLNFNFEDPENLVLGVNAYTVGFIMSIDNWQAPYI